MRKYKLLIFLLLSSLCLDAQDFFDWSVGGENTSLTFQFLVADDSGIVAVGESNPVNMIRSEPRFLQSDNEETSISGYSLNESSQWILFFNKAGKLKHRIKTNIDYNRIHGIAATENQQMVLLLSIEEVQYNDNDEPMGYAPRFMRLGRDRVKAGYYLVYLSRNGDYLKSIHAPTINFEGLEVTNFQAHPNGSFVLAGGADPGKPVLTEDVKLLGGGGDFILMLDTMGNVQWVDVVSHRSNSCCTGNGQGVNVSITSDGTIYLGSSYLNGGVFSNGVHTLASAKYSKNKTSNFEAYIVSYKNNGAINWIKNYGAQSRLFALHGNETGVYASHFSKGAVAFGSSIDTSGAKFNGLSFLNKNGKVEWTKMSNQLKVQHITEINNQVILLQTDERFDFHKKIKVDDKEMPERTRTLVTSIDKKQNLTVLNSTYFDFENRNDPLLIASDLAGNLYLGGIVFCGTPINLTKFESSLPSVECYGGTPVIGKVKLK